jgi:hypothetical protein
LSENRKLRSVTKNYQSKETIKIKSIDGLDEFKINLKFKYKSEKDDDKFIKDNIKNKYDQHNDSTLIDSQ